MRIAMVVPPWFKVPPDGYGGIEVLVSLWADGLVDKGHEVTLFTVADSVTKADKFTVFDKEMKSYLDDAPSNFLNIAVTHSLASYIEISRGGYDIIHDNTWKEGLCSTAFMDIPVVHTLHSAFDEGNKGFYSLFKNYPGIHFVTISNYQQTCFPDLNYSATVYNGVNFPKYPFSEEKEDFFFYIGRFNDGKAPHLACEVAERLGVKLVLAGKLNERAERSYFDQYIKPHLSDKIKFIGEVGQWSKEKMDMFSRGKAYLYPIQWDEPFGITMAEAMACGTPVVTFKRGAAPEVVAHNETGFVVETMDEFVDAVKHVNEISPRKCRERVEKMFTADAMVDGYEKVYTEVLGGK
ncbi:MAG: glycosyltransferase family 4 protein [Dehalococcoidales bacterium]|nr:glycosyltransferase family 4 protein [Dehalococcoidales bacterium]